MNRFNDTFINRLWQARQRNTDTVPDEGEIARQKWRTSAWKQVEAAGFSGDTAVRMVTDPRSDTQRGLNEVIAEAKAPLFSPNASASIYARRGKK